MLIKPSHIQRLLTGERYTRSRSVRIRVQLRQAYLLLFLKIIIASDYVAVGRKKNVLRYRHLRYKMLDMCNGLEARQNNISKIVY